MQGKLGAMRAAGIPENRIAAATTGTPEQILARAQAFATRASRA